MTSFARLFNIPTDTVLSADWSKRGESRVRMVDSPSHSLSGSLLIPSKKRGRYTKVMKKTLFIEIRENSDKIIFRERYTKKIENDREWDRERNYPINHFLVQWEKKKRFAKNREKKTKKEKKVHYEIEYLWEGVGNSLCVCLVVCYGNYALIEKREQYYDPSNDLFCSTGLITYRDSLRTTRESEINRAFIHDYTLSTL